MERKDEEIQGLERRLTGEQVDNMQCRKTIGSQDQLIQKLNVTINDLKAKLASCKENVSQFPTFHDDGLSLDHTFGEQASRRQTYALVDPRRQTFDVEQPAFNSTFHQQQQQQQQQQQPFMLQQQKSFEPMNTILQVCQSSA